ncbi:MAG TPA: hypothetical protein VMJ64_04475 [Anaerolineales bacterium]|nr:hypothetical protein [Anaerolineales bacterium]
MEGLSTFLASWLARPTGFANLGMVMGLLLIVIGFLTRNSKDRWIGLAILGLSLIAGILRYFYG